jgi:hypothetical protein
VTLGSGVFDTGALPMVGHRADLSFLLAFALAVGWYLGRVGCLVAHMGFWMCSIGIDLASSAF